MRAQLTQSQLADMVGMTKASISGLELGTSKKPSADNLLPLARALGVNPEWLISGKGPKYNLSAVQQRIIEAMQHQNMKPFDLADATGGVLAPQTVDAWITGRAEPTDAEIDIIAGPLRESPEYFQSGARHARESNIRVVYDTRGDPVPDNLSQQEIDAVRDLRALDEDERALLCRMIHNQAKAARAERLKKGRNCA